MGSAAGLLPLPVVIPIIGAIASPLVSRIHRRLPLIVGISGTLASCGVLLAIARQTFAGHGRVIVHYFSNETPTHGQVLGIAFAADPFGLSFAILTAALGTVLMLSALSELSGIGHRELGGLACLIQLLIAALIGAALTADTMNLFIWFEVAAIASYGLTGFFLEQPTALEAAFKVLVLTSIGGFFVFAGSGMLYAARGALNFGQLHVALHGHLGGVELVALAMLIAGFAVKAGLAPFHGWLPDAHAQGPGAVSALFSAVMVDLGIIALVRLALQVYGPGSGHRLLGLLTGLGIASALLGALMALAQDDLKRLLAWDTISQMGVLLVGFASARPDGVAGATLHLVNHGLFKALLFLCAGAVVHATGMTRLSDMGGLARRRPLLTAGFTAGTMAIAGIPGFNGYLSLGLIHDALRAEPAVFALALVAQVVTVAAFARAAYLGFYKKREPYAHLEPLHLGMRVSLVALGLGCLALGVLPQAIVDRVGAPAAAVLLHPGTYAAGVLSGAANLPPLTVHFSYGNPEGLLITAGEVALGILLAAGYLRIPEPRPIRLLRALHTGSVNDYAAFAALGFAGTALVVLL